MYPPEFAFPRGERDAIQRRFAAVPEYARPPLWLVATHPSQATLRRWLDDELGQLDPGLRDDFIGRLRDARGHGDAVAELAAGFVLRQPGYLIEFGPKLEGLTPDLLVTDPHGNRLIVEVWRRGLSQHSVARNAAWAELTRHLRRIRRPLAVAISGDFRVVVEPPDAPARQRIMTDVRRWLSSDMPAESFATEGFVLRIVGTSTTGRLELLPVTDSSTADRRDVVEAIERKVKRYRRIAQRLDLPLLVVLGTEPGTGMSAELVGNILAGRNAVAITLPVHGVGAFDSGEIKMRLTDAPPVFDSALSAVAWLEVNDGAHAQLTEVWPIRTAARPVQPMSPGNEETPTTSR